MATPESKFVVSAQDRASATLKKVGAEFGALSSSARLATTFLTSFGGALSLGAAAAALRSVANLQDQMGKMAQQTGIGVEALSALDYAAKLSDVSTEELGAGISRLTAKMGDVAQGSKETTAIFKALGVSVLGAGGQMRPTEEVLGDIADRFSEFADGPEKTAFAIEIFGRAGAKLIPLLNQGRDGLQEMREEAERLGIVIDSKTAKAAEDFNDNLTRLSATTRGVLMDAFTPLIASLGEIAARFLDARREGLAFGESLDIALAIKGFGTLEEKIAGVREKLEGKKSGRWTGLFSNQSEAELTAELNKLLAIQRRVEGRATSQHPAGFRSSLFGPREMPGATPRFPSAAGKTTTARLEQAALTAQQSAVIEAARDYDKASRAAEVFALKLQVLDAKFFDQGGNLEDYEAAVRDLTKATQTAGSDGVGALQSFADGWLDTIDPMRDFVRQIELVERALAMEFMTPEQASEIKKRLAEALEPIAEADAWAVEAAKNIQDHLGQGLFDILDGNFDNIGKSFSTMLKRMVAEAMAANLARDLFGDFAKSGKVGGLLGSGLSWLGGALSGGLSMRPSHAAGLDYVPYDGYIAQLHRGERVLTASEAKSADTGGITVAPTITINGEMSRSQEARLAVMMRNVALATMADSRRRSMA